MFVSLPTELEQLVNTTIASGAYASEQEVICAALYLFKEHTEYLKVELQRGIEAADRKEFSTMSIEELKAEGRRRHSTARALTNDVFCCANPASQ